MSKDREQPKPKPEQVTVRQEFLDAWGQGKPSPFYDWHNGELKLFVWEAKPVVVGEGERAP